MRNYLSLPQPRDLTDREKEDGMGAYLMMFAAFAVSLPLPVVNLIAAVVYYYINRRKSRYVHFHCLQSLLSQLPTTVLNWGILFILLKVLLFESWAMNNVLWSYIIFAVVANLIYTIFSIVAAVKARKGKFFYFLFFGSYSYSVVYSMSNTLAYENEAPKEGESVTENLPPI